MVQCVFRTLVPENIKPAHSLLYDVVIAELRSQIEEGLTDDEAGRRLQHYGANKIEEGGGVSLTKIFVRQIANAIMLVKLPMDFSTWKIYNPNMSPRSRS